VEAGTGLIDTTTAITWSWIFWNFITAQGAAEQLKEQLHGYFGTFTLSGVTAAWDISNKRESWKPGLADLLSVLFRRPAATVVGISAAHLD
jgi:hypothetical protein